MQTPRPYWSAWASQLHRLKLNAIAAWLLDAGAPVALLGAQALFTVRPFLGPQSDALANLLEEEDQARAFAAYLREEEVT